MNIDYSLYSLEHKNELILLADSIRSLCSLENSTLLSISDMINYLKEK